MLIKFFFIAMLGLILSAAGIYLSRHEKLDDRVTASTFAQNANLLGRYAGAYAGAHETTVSAVSTSTLGTPNWYAAYPGLQAYVGNGSAYVFLSSGLALSPARALTYVSGPNITAGLKSGGSIRDATGRVLPTSVPVPSAIPDGSMVLISRDVVASTTPPTIGSTTQPALAALPAGGAIGPPEMFAGFPSIPVPWKPLEPAPTNGAQSTIAPPPPPDESINPNICYAHGGMPFAITPIGLYVKVGTSTLGLGAVEQGSGRTKLRSGSAAGHYDFSILFNGSSRNFTIACTPQNNTLGSGSDLCDYAQSFSINGGMFTVHLEVYTPPARDWAADTNAPFNATASSGQINCQ
jgi:hypothetical protein